MKKTLRVMLAGLLVGLMGGPLTPNVFGAASGNYTDLLPIGAAGNTTVISNGSGWSLTTLAPSQTFGDALSRAPMTVFQALDISTITNNIAVSTLTFSATPGRTVGSTTFPALWVAAGRSIRITNVGKYSTTGTPNWTWGLSLGTTSVLTTGAVASSGFQADQYFKAVGIITISTTGGSGQVNAFYEVQTTSGSVPRTTLSYSTATAVSVTVDLTSQLSVNPTFQWGTASGSNSLFITNSFVEFIN